MYIRIIYIVPLILCSSWSASSGSGGGGSGGFNSSAFGNDASGSLGSGGLESAAFGNTNFGSLGSGYRNFEGYNPSGADLENGVHASGVGSHRGDAGASNVLVARDVVHHGDGSIYVQRAGDSNGMNGVGTMDPQGIHNAINKAKLDQHAANLAKKALELKQKELEKEIANEKIQARNDQIKLLQDLDKQAAILEQQKPEVLGKKAIPVVNFTEDSYPLRHHIKMINQKMKAIKEAEARTIKAQAELTKLDDITDKFKFDNARVASPKILNNFLQVGGVKPLELDIPVLGSQGSFYIKGNAGHGSHSQGNHVGDNIIEGDDHAHYNDHGYHVPGAGLSGSYGDNLHSGSYGDFYKEAYPYTMYAQ
ncbi:hypothetical protein TUBRATIS_004850 [Tubulinosema ratisbonensis]|uniref:Uncharacterized protein n=1 Tax=Tubulinosema ratisbonensis TaxID=291195 RepID=A0A437AP78_9MICR|nr:hypothetical protein TUBRATIS_004850 [Tubulinosema ratisbonensis]